MNPSLHPDEQVKKTLRDKIMQDAKDFMRPVLINADRYTNKYAMPKDFKKLITRWKAVLLREFPEETPQINEYFRKSFKL